MASASMTLFLLCVIGLLHCLLQTQAVVIGDEDRKPGIKGSASISHTVHHSPAAMGQGSADQHVQRTAGSKGTMHKEHAEMDVVEDGGTTVLSADKDGQGTDEAANKETATNMQIKKNVNEKKHTREQEETEKKTEDTEENGDQDGEDLKEGPEAGQAIVWFGTVRRLKGVLGKASFAIKQFNAKVGADIATFGNAELGTDMDKETCLQLLVGNMSRLVRMPLGTILQETECPNIFSKKVVPKKQFKLGERDIPIPGLNMKVKKQLGTFSAILFRQVEQQPVDTKEAAQVAVWWGTVDRVKGVLGKLSGAIKLFDPKVGANIETFGAADFGDNEGACIKLFVGNMSIALRKPIEVVLPKKECGKTARTVVVPVRNYKLGVRDVPIPGLNMKVKKDLGTFSATMFAGPVPNPEG
jgi:hypothetical protein